MKNSIPVLHSSAAMMKIAEMEYSGANSIFLRYIYNHSKYLVEYLELGCLTDEHPQFRERYEPVRYPKIGLKMTQPLCILTPATISNT